MSGICLFPWTEDTRIEASQENGEALLKKIDLFLSRHILPRFHPEKVYWWLSLSGGKDSYAMASALRDWYDRMGFQFRHTAFAITQWSSATINNLERQLHWTAVEVIDGRTLTRRIGYQDGHQAPCRACSDVRRLLTDDLITRKQSTYPNLVARGLHLSDTAVSLLWRYLRGRSAVEDMIRSEKALPVQQLGEGHYLVKPLTYAREYETQEYAAKRGYLPACCGCPACRYPSRRDIIEETALYAFRGDLWEFDVPGLSSFLTAIGGSGVVDLALESSASGVERKSPLLPEGFFDFVLDQHQKRLSRLREPCWMIQFDTDTDLDELGMLALQRGLRELDVGSRVPLPSLYRRGCGEEEQLKKRMISTLGPLWGAFCLVEPARSALDAFQREVLEFWTNDLWGQVACLLREFYRYNGDEGDERTQVGTDSLPCLNACFCRT